MTPKFTISPDVSPKNKINSKFIKYFIKKKKIFYYYEIKNCYKNIIKIMSFLQLKSFDSNECLSIV